MAPNGYPTPARQTGYRAFVAPEPSAPVRRKKSGPGRVIPFPRVKVVERPSTIPRVPRRYPWKGPLPSNIANIVKMLNLTVQAYRASQNPSNIVVRPGATVLSGYTLARTFNYVPNLAGSPDTFLWGEYFYTTSTEAPLNGSGETYGSNGTFAPQATFEMPAPTKPSNSFGTGEYLREVDMWNSPIRWGSYIKRIYTRNETGPYGLIATPGVTYPANPALPVFPLPAFQPVQFPAEPAFAPWPILKPMKRVKEKVSPDPYAYPRPARPRPRPRPAPAVQVIVRPGVPPVVRPGPGHTYTPPRPRERESKAQTRWAQAWAGVADAVGFDAKSGFDTITEAIDWIDAIYYALPEWARNGEKSPYDKAKAIYENMDQIDPAAAATNILLMEAMDRGYGALSSKAKAELFKAGGDVSFYGPGL